MNPKGSLGTGFYVEPELVLTNYHVIEGAQFVEMKLRNGLETFGKVVKSDVRLDLALVRVQARGKPVQFHSGAIPLGATVEAIGHPKGLEFSITRGVVSALRRQPSPFGVSGKEVLFVQTDAPINPGNSGGPLFLGNNVVAVNDNKFAGKGIEGIGFSVHYTEVQDFLREGF
jgi:S1-C subfamily serine protease